MGLKKFLKKARKAIGLPAITLGNVAKVGAAAALGGVPAIGATVLKSKLRSAAIGGIKRIVRTKAEKAQLKKIGTLAPPTIVGITSAVTRPGGAPLRGVAAPSASSGKRRSRRSTRRVAAASPKSSRSSKNRSGATNGTKVRKPPSPAQLAAREKFKQMVAAKRKARASGAT